MQSLRILYVVFFLSGATGLVYEVIWVRLTGLVFGNTSHAIAVVLGAFMAGLALGSWCLGRLADRVPSALKMYGLLEIGIGITAAIVPFVFGTLGGVYWTVAPSIGTVPGANGILRFLSSFLILLIPTFLMGGTLPVLARFFTLAVSEVQRKVGVLYALNTFGAAFGTLMAALFFIPQLGNMRSTLVVAACNIAIGIFAIVMDGRLTAGLRAPEPSSPRQELPTAGRIAGADRLILLTLAMSGFVSMVYEVSWTRALTALIGSSTYAFSIMLVTFLVGIAAGSSLAVRWKGTASLRRLGLIQLGIALGGFFFLIAYTVAPYVLIALIRALSYSFPAVLTTQFLLCAVLMIFATLCMGAALPVASQLYSSRLTLLGRSIGNVYSVNTIGAIAGSLVAGFVFVPWLGTERTILAGLLFNTAIAALVLSHPSAARRTDIPKWSALALLVVATVSMRGGLLWTVEAMDRGILVYSRAFDARPELRVAEHYQDTDVVYFNEGNNATISVRKGEDYVGLRTNGKVDASNKADMLTQLMIGYLPILYHPSPRSTMIIGYGGGVTVGAASAFPEVEEIDCLEIEEAVIGAAPFFSEFNRKSYENPKVHVIFDDARNYMNVTRKQYDVIISEPSNPWIAGVASLFTSEFYDRAAAVLKPDGVFAQWIQLYELDPEDLRMVLREFQEKFPYVSVWVCNGDLVVIGTRQPQTLDLPRWVRLASEDPVLARELHDYFKVGLPEGILAYYVMSTDKVKELAVTNRRNTDDHPLLEFNAPRQLFRETRTLNVALLYDHKDALVPEGARLGNLEKVYSSLVEPFLDMNRATLANQAADVLEQVDRGNDASLHLARGQIRFNAGDLDSAEQELLAGRKIPAAEPRVVAGLEEMLGLLYQRLGDPDRAIPHFEAAVAAEPTRQLPLRRLAEIYGANEDWTNGARWMEAYVATGPLGIGHQYGTLGDYYLAGRDIQNAAKAFKTGMEKDPYTFWVHFRMGRMFEEQQEIPQAIQHYEIASRYGFDRSSDVYVRLATLYKNNGRFGDAVSLLERGRRIFPTNLDIYRLHREFYAANPVTD
jgi:spermidine synthase